MACSLNHVESPAGMEYLLHEIFLRTAQRWPERMAIDVPPAKARPARQTLTYAETAQAAQALAARLAPLLGAESMVAIAIPRTSPRLYVAQLAVLMAGGGFTCIDTSFPADRVEEILDDSGAVAMLRARDDHPGGIAVEVLHEGAGTARPAAATPESLAYVIYTSGTTGRPKGVMIEHRSITNLVLSDVEYFDLGPDDRVIQGSSAAYDSSLEEVWLAFAVGGTLLVMDDEAARLGPDLVGWLRNERATVFCPPPTLLRSTGCADPQAALPDLRLLYVGGEALPQDIAVSWSAGRRMVNGYGPTECTVTCLRAEVRGDEAVPIGIPVSGAQGWALGEDGQEVPTGEKGELCIGGIGLARGYWQSPELTAQKFITHPQFGRIYRTGDLVHRDAAGNFFYHGRIDAQVKLRGYRIELGEVESRLAALPGVRAAGCRVQDDNGVPSLVCHVVPENPQSPTDTEALKAELGHILPHYMIPARIGVIDDLPTTIGGKLDRARLPAIAAAVSSVATDAGIRPRSPLEAKFEAAISDILRRPDGVCVTADFFELGGDSLSAAMLVTLLRDDPETEWVSVSDIYEARSVAELALRGGEPHPVAAHEDQICGPLPGQYPLLVTLGQAAWLLAMLGTASVAAWAVSFKLFPLALGNLGLIPFILLSPLFEMAGLAAYTAAVAAIAIVAKHLLIGRYTPRRDVAWGAFYLRNWIVQQTVRLLPWRILAGTDLQLVILRALGAKIGQRVHIHRGVQLWRGGWDLLTIGDDVCIGQEAMLRLVEMDRQHIVIGPITLDNGATVETRAGLAGHTRIGAGGCLSALAALSAHETIPAGQLWDGVPARAVGPAQATPALSSTSGRLSQRGHAWALLAAEALVAVAVLLPAELAALLCLKLFAIDEAAFWRWMYNPSADAALWAILLGVAFITVPVTLAVSALVSRALGRVQPGVISLWSFGSVRVWLKTSLLMSASDWLSGTLFWPIWLRAAGMKIGKGSEISTILDVVPDLVSIGGGTFFADGIYLGGPRIQNGTVTLARTHIGNGTFLGNHAVIRGGQHLPDDILIGVSTPADATRIRPGTSWFGHPSIELPRREVVEVDPSLTHNPSTIRYINRLFWESLRFALPLGPLVAGIGWYVLVARMGEALSGPAFVLAGLPLAMMATTGALCLAVLVLKWALLGRVRPGQHALWSCWCSRWDFLYMAWGKWARHVLEPLEGTLLLNAYLRGIGMKIGKRVILGPGFAQVVDPDMLLLEDDSTVNAIFQAHTFEDRVLKIDYVRVGKGATIGAASVPLYGANIDDGCWVGPHSAIMKQEHLLPRHRYHGAPARNA